MGEKIKVKIRGVEYSSLREAAGDLDVSAYTVRKAYLRGTLDNVGLRKVKGDWSVPVSIRGVEYPSMGAAARALNVAKGTIKEARRRGTLDGVGLSKEKLRGKDEM